LLHGVAPRFFQLAWLTGESNDRLRRAGNKAAPMYHDSHPVMKAFCGNGMAGRSFFQGGQKSGMHDDCLMSLEKGSDSLDMSNVSLLGYVCMTNRYHFLVTTPEGIRKKGGRQTGSPSAET
jgi:hypothetical protein